jgi:hypothetical protein
MTVIDELIEHLGTDDERTRRRAGDDLLRQGQRALPALVNALQHPSARIRQSAAFLLGRLDTPAQAAGLLAQALRDDDPKVRKNAAVSLGRAGGPDHAQQLADALAQESIAWVRPSLVLALGALGGAAAYPALVAVEPQSEEEREALRKALDRTTPTRPTATWTVGGWRPAMLLEVPPGLEEIAQSEAFAQGLPRPSIIDEGRLRLPNHILPDDLTARLRCSYGPLLLAGEGPPLPLNNPRICAEWLAAMIRSSVTLRRWREWVTVDQPELRFRLAFGPHVHAELLRSSLSAARAAAAPLGMTDSPSRYAIELLVESGPDGARLLVRPSFSPDGRFSYRLGDVPASIDPVIAAGLAQVVYTRADATVFDPTCGSATLLIERARLGDKTQLLGMDIQADALEVAKTNLVAAGFRERCDLRLGDAGNRRNWPKCDEVLANLPFGLRTRNSSEDIAGLHRAIGRNLGEALRPGGRAVLYTARPGPLEEALDQISGLRFGGRLRILAGGLWVTALIAEQS